MQIMEQASRINDISKEQEAGENKQPWTPQEDVILVQLVEKIGA